MHPGRTGLLPTVTVSYRQIAAGLEPGAGEIHRATGGQLEGVGRGGREYADGRLSIDGEMYLGHYTYGRQIKLYRDCIDGANLSH